MKTFLKQNFPTMHRYFCYARMLFRDFVLSERRGHYYDGTFKQPERCLTEIIMPSHIDTILDLGCGNGRNLIPFDGKLKLWGIDIVPKERITFVRDFKDFLYEHLSVEQLTNRFREYPQDLSRTFIFSSGTMMYVSRKNQERFFNVCKKNGCTSFMFQEYEPNNQNYPIENFKLPEQMFNKQRFRDDKGLHQPVCYATF